MGDRLEAQRVHALEQLLAGDGQHQRLVGQDLQQQSFDIRIVGGRASVGGQPMNGRLAIGVRRAGAASVFDFDVTSGEGGCGFGENVLALTLPFLQLLAKTVTLALDRLDFVPCVRHGSGDGWTDGWTRGRGE